MALGGGTWTTQSKALPGSYLNFVSAARATASLSQRGVAALALELNWGAEGEIITVQAGDFEKSARTLFGYSYADGRMKGLRDLFKNIRTGYLYRLNGGGEKAQNKFAAARYTGTRGNDLKIVIQENSASTEAEKVYDVKTFLDAAQVDKQTVKTASELVDNDFVAFLKDAALELTAGAALTGGTNGTADLSAHQAFLDKAESYAFNALGCLASDTAVKALYAGYTKRMRDEAGVKFQTVLFRQAADHEGVISVENGLVDDADDTSAVYWVTGVAAGCPVNRSNTNRLYDGEFAIAADYTQAQLEEGLRAGKWMFHRVGGEIRVLEDRNTFVTVTPEKSADFADNQTIRVLDQIGNDVAALFNTKYLGSVPNDNAGRISLWNDIVKHHQELEAIRAIEGFDPDQVTVAQGDTKKAVVVQDAVSPVSAMAQLYMTIVVE